MKLLVATVLMFAGLAAHADSVTVSSRTVTLPVDLSAAHVRKTNAGYGQTYLVKILVPELAAETVMNHRNEGEGAPCLATYEVDTIEQLIQGRPSVEKAAFKIELVKDTYLDEAKVCHVTLTENVTTSIRGFQFIHSRASPLPDRNEADCK